MWPECNVKRKEERKIKVILSTQNNIANKQAHGDVSWPEAQRCLNMKDFALSSHSEVSLQGG